MDKFTVIRKTWNRGNAGDGLLYDPHEENFCCLGFCALACGYSLDDITAIPSPSGLDDVGLWPESFIRSPRESMIEDSERIVAIMDINDDGEIYDADREKALIEEFALLGITVEFVDE